MHDNLIAFLALLVFLLLIGAFAIYLLSKG